MLQGADNQVKTLCFHDRTPIASGHTYRMFFPKRFENFINARYQYHDNNQYGKPNFKQNLLPRRTFCQLYIINSSVIFLLQNLVNKKTYGKFTNFTHTFSLISSLFYVTISSFLENLDPFTFSSTSYLISFDRKNL